MKKLFVLTVVLTSFLLVGCAQKKVVQPTPQGVDQQPLQSQSQASAVTKETPERLSMVRPEERVTEKQLAKIETENELAKYKEESGLFKDIYFDFDRYDVREDAQAVLRNIASWLLKNSSPKILVEGHCDDRGTSEYNLALGDRRAKAVRDYIVALGVASGRVETISYGEENPVCAVQTEECWAKNRRAHFIVLREAVRQ